MLGSINIQEKHSTIIFLRCCIWSNIIFHQKNCVQYWEGQSLPMWFTTFLPASWCWDFKSHPVAAFTFACFRAYIENGDKQNVLTFSGWLPMERAEQKERTFKVTTFFRRIQVILSNVHLGRKFLQNVPSLFLKPRHWKGLHPGEQECRVLNVLEKCLLPAIVLSTLPAGRGSQEAF